jgi:hypothetical protein
MKRWKFKLWTGSNNFTSTVLADSYAEAKIKYGVAGFPPGYIWSIEPVEE